MALPARTEGRSAGVDRLSAADERDQVRQRIIVVATDLLERDGHDALTIRAVAEAAGVQPMAIYRLIGSKEGLLEEVSKRSLAIFIAKRRPSTEPLDPIDELRSTWDLAIDFGLANPALYTLMFSDPTPATSEALRTGTEIVLDCARRLARHGRLALDEQLAVSIIQASARGAVLTWLSTPEDQRDPEMLIAMREASVAAVTNLEPSVSAPTPAGAARSLRASLPDLDCLSDAEGRLLNEWLDRIIAAD